MNNYPASARFTEEVGGVEVVVSSSICGLSVVMVVVCSRSVCVWSVGSRRDRGRIRT